MIADAVEAHCVPDRRVRALDRDLHLPGQVGEVGDIAGAYPKGDDLAAFDAAPDEGVGRKRDLVLLRPAKHVTGVAMRSEDVRKARCVAEAVDVVADRRRDPEPVAEIALPMRDLAVKPGFGRQVQVGLQELAAGDVPLPALDMLADALEQLGMQLLHLLVEPGLAAREDELRILVAPVGRRAHRGQRLVGSSLPGPQPDRVDVGVADHVNEHRKSNDANLREGEQRRDHPFTAPAIRAPMMKRWSTRKTTTAGTMESTLAAARNCVDVVL